jgi:hypothetical protein
VVAGKVEDQAKGPVAFESIVFVINQVRECVLSSNVLSPADFRSPAVLLSGTVDYQMYNSFRDQFGRAPTTGLVVIELSTLGGDPEVARMMGRMCAITATSIRAVTSSSLERRPSIPPVQPSCRSSPLAIAISLAALAS